MPLRKWRGNTRRENRLEELGRVDAEKAYTKKGKRNLKDEKSRIRKELNKGGWITKKQKQNWITKKEAEDHDTTPMRKWISKKKKNWITKKKNTGRENLLEEMGRIDARKHPDAADRSEKKRVIGELRKGYKGGSRPRPQGPHTWVRKKPKGVKIAIKGW